MTNEVRLIDANALHKILEEAQDGTRRIYSSLVDYRDKEVCKGELGTYARVKRMVEDAPTIDGDKWTPTDERLPDANVDVLVVYEGGVEGRYVGADSLTKDGEWLWAEEDEKVTHWMPLPEPPKEE